MECSSLQTQYERNIDTNTNSNPKIITDWNISTKSNDYKG